MNYSAIYMYILLVLLESIPRALVDLAMHHFFKLHIRPQVKDEG